MDGKEPDSQFGLRETEKRRDEVIRRMANTPPQPKTTTPRRPGKKKKAVAGRAARKGRGTREA